MIILYGIITLMGVVVLALSINAYEDFKENNIEKISFKESLDLVGLPIITFKQGIKKYNFLLDTGSDKSHINKSLIDNSKIKYTSTNASIDVFGMEGNINNVNIVNLDFSFNKVKYNGNFLVNDLSSAFDNIKATYGISLHGILGGDFFQEYKYIIDFNKLIAYSKK